MEKAEERLMKTLKRLPKGGIHTQKGNGLKFMKSLVKTVGKKVKKAAKVGGDLKRPDVTRVLKHEAPTASAVRGALKKGFKHFRKQLNKIQSPSSSQPPPPPPPPPPAPATPTKVPVSSVQTRKKQTQNYDKSTSSVKAQDEVMPKKDGSKKWFVFQPGGAQVPVVKSKSGQKTKKDMKHLQAHLKKLTQHQDTRNKKLFKKVAHNEKHALRKLIKNDPKAKTFAFPKSKKKKTFTRKPSMKKTKGTKKKTKGTEKKKKKGSKKKKKKKGSKKKTKNSSNKKKKGSKKKK